MALGLAGGVALAVRRRVGRGWGAGVARACGVRGVWYLNFYYYSFDLFLWPFVVSAFAFVDAMCTMLITIYYN